MSLSEKLISAAKNGNTKEVRKLLSKGAMFTKDQFGNTALHEAAWNGNNDIVKILLTGFCFVDSINNTGFTPLHLASQNGHAKVAKTLLKWKANPTLLNQHGETALHLVAKYDHSNVVASFAAHKICLDLLGKDGNTSLHIAAKLGNIQTVKALLSAGAHPAIFNDRQLRPVDYADSGDYPALAKLLHNAAQKHKPKTSGGPMSRLSPITSPDSPYSPATAFTQSAQYSLSQPTDYELSQLPAVNSRMLRASSMSTAAKQKVSPDVKASGQKKRSKTVNKDDRTHKVSGSLSPTPHKYFSSQDDLDSTALCVGGNDRPFRSVSPNGPSSQATIDQLLTEIETECLGPGYKYKPQEAHPFSQIANNPSTNHDVLSAQNSRLNYDYLPTRNTNSNSNKSPRGSPDRTTEHAQKRSLPPTPSDPSVVPPRGKFKHHTYEPLLPKEDGDTYVYMAPLSDYPELTEQELPKESHSLHTPDTQSLVSESGSELSAGGSKKKVAAIRDSPIEADRKFEPNPVLEPVKGILITGSSCNTTEKSRLEEYVQKELDTIRQAFQIRLTQLEKRYQRQLEFEKKKLTVPPVTQGNVRHQRRNSWHSSEEKSGGPDLYESDPANELPESQREAAATTTAPVDDFSDYEDMSGGTCETQELVGLKVKEYRERMMHHFKEQSEARIAAIERQYQSQMSEVQRKCQDTASEKVDQLQNKIKDLEGRLEIQTLV